MPKLKYLMHSVLILDEIRLEATGKSILIGVYDDGIIVPMFPVAVPKLTVRVHFTLLEAAETFTLRITGDGGSVFGEVTDKLPSLVKGSKQALAIEVTPVVFPHEQELKVAFGLDDAKADVVLRMPVRLPISDAERMIVKITEKTPRPVAQESGPPWVAKK